MDHRTRKANRKDISGVGFDTASNEVQVYYVHLSYWRENTEHAQCSSHTKQRLMDELLTWALLNLLAFPGNQQRPFPAPGFSKGTLKDYKVATLLHLSEFSWVVMTMTMTTVMMTTMMMRRATMTHM